MAFSVSSSVSPCRVSVAFSAPISKRGILLARLFVPVRHDNVLLPPLLWLRLCNRGVICKIIMAGIMDTHFDRSWGGRAAIHCHCHYVSLGVGAEPNPEPQPEVWWLSMSHGAQNERFAEDKRQAKRLALMARDQQNDTMRCAGSMAVDGAASRRGIRGQRTIPSGDDTEEACGARRPMTIP
jgi:hypothetical protein